MNSCTFESLTLTPDTPIINTRTVRLQCKMSDHRFNHYSNFIVFDVDPFIIINHLTVLKSAHFFNCYRPWNAFKIIVVYVTENMSEWECLFSNSIKYCVSYVHLYDHNKKIQTTRESPANDYLGFNCLFTNIFQSVEIRN